MNKRSFAKILLISTFALGFLSGFLVRSCGYRHSARHDEANAEANAEVLESRSESVTEDAVEEDPDTLDTRREIFYRAPKISYSKTFSDLNDAHLRMADSLGLETIPKSRGDVASIKGLKKIRSGNLYVIDTLKYSVPYLTSKAARELESIASAFRDSLEDKGLLTYELVVTSVLRTEEDVNRLRRSGNPNASDNSAHCYGTTFDISYTRYYREVETEEYMQPYELTKVLAEVLRDQRDAGRCLVKYERKEHCFHITSSI